MQINFHFFLHNNKIDLTNFFSLLSLIDDSATHPISQSGDEAALLAQLESEMDNLNKSIDNVLFDQISDRKYHMTVLSNPDFGRRVQKILNDEVEIRVMIQQAKSLTENIRKSKKEYEDLIRKTIS